MKKKLEFENLIIHRFFRKQNYFQNFDNKIITVAKANQKYKLKTNKMTGKNR